MSAELVYSVRRSPRARRVRVSVDAQGGVQVVLPQRVPRREAAAAVAELRPWIERRVAEAAAARARLAGEPGTVPVLGAALRVVLEEGRSRVHRRDGNLLVPAADPGAALERWYRRTAREEIALRLGPVTAALGRRHAGLTIRNQRTRWGSCSANGTMSFNWRLLLAPDEVLDYVIWHEACHLVVMDHSRDFWSLLERHLPGFRAPQRWLRDNGTALVLPEVT